MTFEQWIQRVREILKQYDEGAVTAAEVYRAILFYGFGVTEEEKQ